jgi:hypothetical protein
MTQDEIIEMAKQAGYDEHQAKFDTRIEALAKLVAEKEREVVANWIMDRGFATGHGDSIVDLLDQLEWQIAEKEREACAKLADEYADGPERNYSEIIADAIRARGQA